MNLLTGGWCETSRPVHVGEELEFELLQPQVSGFTCHLAGMMVTAQVGGTSGNYIDPYY